MQELTRYGVSVLVAAGFDVASAYPAIVTSNAYMFGAIGMLAHTERGGKKTKKSAGQRQLTQAQVRALVEWGLDALMDGLSATLKATKRANVARLKRPGRASTRD